MCTLRISERLPKMFLNNVDKLDKRAGRRACVKFTWINLHKLPDLRCRLFKFGRGRVSSYNVQFAVASSVVGEANCAMFFVSGSIVEKMTNLMEVRGSRRRPRAVGQKNFWLAFESQKRNEDCENVERETRFWFEAIALLVSSGALMDGKVASRSSS